MKITPKVPRRLYAVAWSDKLRLDKPGLLWANGSDYVVGQAAVPFTSYEEALQEVGN